MFPVCPLPMVKGEIMYFLVNASPSKLLDSINFKLCRCFG